MRSSESANSTITSTWLPKVRRSGKSQKAASASPQGSASQICSRWRSARNATARARADAVDPSGAAELVASASVTAIKSRRLDQQDQHRQRVDEKAAGGGEHVFAGGIADAEQDGGHQRALEAAEATDRDHQQEEHQIEHRKARGEAEELDREPAAERREPAADRKGEREQPVDVDADRLRHAPVVDRGADLGAELGALKAVPQHGDQGGPDRDDEDPVGREGAEAAVDLAREIARQRDALRARAVE